MTGKSTNFLVLIIAVYAAAALSLVPFLDTTFSQDEEDGSPQIDETRIANYDIIVELDTAENKLVAEETINWVNAGGAPTDELRFHLYMNAFRSADTLFFENGGFEEDSAGWIDVTSIRLADGTDLLAGSRVDETVMIVRLPEAVAPGEQINVTIDFSVQLPKIISRTGYSDRYYMVAQWYPKLGVYLDGRWICPQYHRFAEYFADFGSYRVEITVPKNYQLEATGIRQRGKTGPSKKTLVYFAHPVHDFAWAASPFFRKNKRVLTYAAGESQAGLEVHLMLQRDRQHLAEKYFTAIGKTLEYFSSLYGEYPYPVLKVIDPAPGRGLRSGGMEYPMLITAGSSWLEESLLPGAMQLELVTIHETAHQVYHSALASNEVRYPWLDEGMTTFTESEVADSLGNRTELTELLPVLFNEISVLSPYAWKFKYSFEGFASLLYQGMEYNSLNYLRRGYLPVAEIDPIDAPAPTFFSFSTLFSSAYHKPALMLGTLKGLLGEQVFNAFLRQYYQTFRFRHPTGDDFRQIVSEFAGEDMDWFFRQVLDSTRILDYAVEEVTPGKAVFRRKGGVVVPQKLQVILSDGSLLDFNWPLYSGETGRLWMEDFYEHDSLNGVSYRMRESAGKSWLTVELRGPLQIQSAKIDPRYTYKLDTNFANNSRTMEKDETFSRRGTLKWIRILTRWLHNVSAYN